MPDNVVPISNAPSAGLNTCREFFVTFGQGSAFKDKYVHIIVDGTAVTDFEGIARDVMHKSFGAKWAFIYQAHEWPQIKKDWGYTQLAQIVRNDQGYYRAR